MKRAFLLLALLVVVLIAGAAALWHFDQRRRSFYTDGAGIDQAVGEAYVREILWQPPRELGGEVNTTMHERAACVSDDGSSIIFGRDGGGPDGSSSDLLSAMRTAGDVLAAPSALIDINGDHADTDPALSRDGQTLIFASDRPGGFGGFDLWLSHRGDFGWAQPVNLGPAVNGSQDECGPTLSPDGLRLVFSSNRAAFSAAVAAPAARPGAVQGERDRAAIAGHDLYVAMVTPDGFAPAAPLPALNSAADDRAAAFSPAGDFLYFGSNRTGGRGGFDLYRARIVGGREQSPEALGGEINSPANDSDPAPIMGGFSLLFASDRGREAGAASARDDNLWRSDSREVFVRIAPRSPMDIAAIWTWLGPLLMRVVLLLIGVALLWVLWHGVRSKRLGLLARCVLASVLAHVMLMILLTFWQVTTQIAGLIDREGTRVAVIASNPQPSLGQQLRGGMTEASLQALSTDAAARLALQSPVGAPAPEVIHTRSGPAEMPADEQAALDAEMREAAPKPTQTPDAPRPTVTHAAPVAQAVAAPSEAQRLASNEASPQAAGPEPPRSNRAASDQAVQAQSSSAVTMQPPATPSEVSGPLPVNAVARDAVVEPRETAAPANTQARIDPLSVAAIELAQPHADTVTSGSEAAGPALSVRTDTVTRRAGASAVAAAPQSATVALDAGPASAAIAPAEAMTARMRVSEAPTPHTAARVQSSQKVANVNALVIDSPSLTLPTDIAGAGNAASEAAVAAPRGTEALAARSAAPGGEASGPTAPAIALHSSRPPAAVNEVEPAAGVSTGVATGDLADSVVVSDAPAVGNAGAAALPGPRGSSTIALALPADTASNGVAAGATPQPSLGAPQSVISSSQRQRAGGGAGLVASSIETNDFAPGVGPVAAEAALPDAVRGEAAREAPMAASASMLQSGAGASLEAALPGTSMAAAPELRVPSGGVEGGPAAGVAEQSAVGDPLSALAGTSPRRAHEGGVGQSGAATEAARLAPGASAAIADAELSPIARGDVTRDAAVGAVASSHAIDGEGTLNRSMPPEAVVAAQLRLPDGKGGGAEQIAAKGEASPGAPALAANVEGIGRAQHDAKGGLPSAALNPAALAPEVGAAGALERDSFVDSAAAAGTIPDAMVRDGPGAPVAASLGEFIPPEATVEPGLTLRLPTDVTAPNNPYVARRENTRLETVKQMGGSEETERAVALALDWLARHQSPDGRWATREFDADCRECKGEGRFDTDIATTALSLLCFLGADHTHLKENKYQANVDRGLRWLTARQQEDGDLRGGETMYSHGIAAIALGEAYGMTGDPRLRDRVERAVKFIDQARNRNVGGWRYEPRQAGDTSVTGWQVMAMMSAKRAGLMPPDQAFAAASTWMTQVSLPNRPGQYAYQPGQPPSPSMTAEGMFVQQLLGLPRDDPRMRGSVDLIIENLPLWDIDPNTYYWYYATLAMFQYQGEPWRIWNERLTRVLLKNQRTSGPEAGSWSPEDNWSKIGGRVYQTALCTLCLEVYYRYLPMYQNAALARSRNAVRGTVTDAATGLPLPQAMVRIDMQTAAGALVAVTDNQGKYALALPELPAEFVALAVSLDGYTPQTTNIAADEARTAEVTRDFALRGEQANIIVLEADPQVHHLGNNEFEGRINSQFQTRADGLEYTAEFTLQAAHLPPRARRVEIVLMAKGAQALNTISINGEGLGTPLNGSPRDGSFGEFRTEIPLTLLREGANTLSIRSSNSEGDLDDFEFVNVQIHVQ